MDWVQYPPPLFGGGGQVSHELDEEGLSKSDFRKILSFYILRYVPRLSRMTGSISMEIGLVWRLLDMNMILSVGQGMNGGCLCIRTDAQV